MKDTQLSNIQIDVRGPGHDSDGAADPYERYQKWDPPALEGVARFVAAGGDEATYLILGCATGANDVLPLAHRAPNARIVAGDIDEVCLAKLRDRVRRERLNVRVRRIDLTRDLSSLGTFDRVTLFFVLHRLPEWRSAIRRVADRLAPGGHLYLSEFAGPDGVVYLSNLAGGRAQHGIARLIRRYFELHPMSPSPELRSTSIAPVLDEVRTSLTPAGVRVVPWKQHLTLEDMIERIERGAYAPFRGGTRVPAVIERLRREFAADLHCRVTLVERIRIYRFLRS